MDPGGDRLMSPVRIGSVGEAQVADPDDGRDDEDDGHERPPRSLLAGTEPAGNPGSTHDGLVPRGDAGIGCDPAARQARRFTSSIAEVAGSAGACYQPAWAGWPLLLEIGRLPPLLSGAGRGGSVRRPPAVDQPGR